MHDKSPRTPGVPIATLVAVALSTFSAVRTTSAATVTVSATCGFEKAVATLNARADQWPCGHSGFFGTSDTVSIPVGTFYMGSSVDITRSMKIQGGGKWDSYLYVNNSSLQYAIRVKSPSIVVKMNDFFLGGTSDVLMAGLYVTGANDTNVSDNNLELSYVVVSGFTSSGIQNASGRVLVQNSLIYENRAGWSGGGVSSYVDPAATGASIVPSFVAKNSAISFNSSYEEGGGVYSEGKLDLRSALLQDNDAKEGAAIFEAATYTPGTATQKNGWCNVERDSSTSAPSEFDDNVVTADYADSYSIITTDIRCDFHDSIGSGNSSPFCSDNSLHCPQ